MTVHRVISQSCKWHGFKSAIVWIILCLTTTYLLFLVWNVQYFMTSIFVVARSSKPLDKATSWRRTVYSWDLSAMSASKWRLKAFVQSLPDEIEAYVNIVSGQWTRNETALEHFRHLSELKMSTYDNIMLTQQNTRPGRYLSPGTGEVPVLATEYIVKRLPKFPLLPTPLYNRCSLVGSGGILKGSQCGSHIDKADMVFRFNLAPTSGYEHDVGTKTNVTTMNTSIVSRRYGSLTSDEKFSEFYSMLDTQGALVWSPAYANQMHRRLALRSFRRIKHSKSKVDYVIGDPSHFRALQDMWQSLELTHKMSTGFYFMTSALSLCDNIDLYGFWSLAHAPDGRNVSYHYYDDITLSESHDWSREVKFIMGLHHLGVVQVHVGNCNS